MALEANPHSVLSAIGQVGASSTPAVQSIYIQITDSTGADAGITAAVDANEGGTTTVPVLLLKPSAAYTMQAVGALPDGSALLSNSATFETSPLPIDITHFNVEDGGQYSGGFILVANEPAIAGNRTFYAEAVDQTGWPVWYVTLPPGIELTGDFKKQFDGTYTVAAADSTKLLPILVRPGPYYQFDNLGNLLKVWQSPAGVATNEHEFTLLPDGTALIMGYVSRTIDMSQYVDGGDPNATVYGSEFQKIASDGTILWSWTDLDHIPISDVGAGDPLLGTNLDLFHTNSFFQMADGNYLISINRFSEIVKVSSTDGSTIWTLGGKGSSFSFPNDPLNGPSWQHAARELPNGDIICMDNGDFHKPPTTRVVEYALDTDAGTATMVWEFQHQPSIYAGRFGNAQLLHNGNFQITGGEQSATNPNGLVDEVTPEGQVLWEMVDSITPLTADGGNSLPDLGIYRSFRIETVY